MGYVLDHFGTKEPFRSLQKVKVRVGILMHKVNRQDVKLLTTFLPEPNFKIVYSKPDTFILKSFVKDVYKNKSFPLEFVYNIAKGD